jgi:hypothetical protein
LTGDKLVNVPFRGTNFQAQPRGLISIEIDTRDSGSPDIK